MRALLLFLPSLLLSGPAGAQLELPTTFAETHWSVEEGLPQDSVTGLCQDAAGYLWIATFGGLARFDGVDFDTYYVGNRPDLPGSRFVGVAVDGDGELYTIAQRVGMLRYVDDEFSGVEFLGSDGVLFDDPSGDVWLRSTAGLGRVEDGEYSLVRPGEVRGACVTASGTIWLTTVGDGLVEIRGDTERVLGDVTSTPGRPFVTMVVDREGRLWGGNWRGLWRATDATNSSFERVEAAGDGIRQLVLGLDGEVWIGSGSGLQRWLDGRLDRVREGPHYSVLYVDRRGNLWCTGPGAGLRMLRPSVLSEVTAALELTPDDVWSVSCSPADELAVVQRKVTSLHRKSGVEHLEFRWNAHAVLRDRADRLWIAGSDRVVCIEGDTRTEYRDPSGLFGQYHALHETADGELWVGARGLSRFDGRSFVGVQVGEIENVHCILEDATEAGLWVGTQRGLAHTSRDGTTLRWMTAADGLAPGAVRALHLDERGVLWVATYGGGLSRVEGEDIATYTRETGLPDDFLSSIVADDDGRLWFSSNRGPFVAAREVLDEVARGERRRAECVLFTPGEGAREASGGNQPSAARDASGRIWFPHVAGLAAVHPELLRLDEPPPSLLFEEVELSTHRELRVEFAALGFTWPTRVLVQYRLAELEDRWIDTRGRRELEFSYLPPGDYQLELRARNGFGPWSEVSAHAVSVPAHFYETWIFRTAAVLAIAGVVFALGLVRQRRLRAHANRLRELYRGRDAARAALSRSREELRRLSRLLLSQQEDQLRTVSAELHDDICQRVAALAIQMETLDRKLVADGDAPESGLRPLVGQAQDLAGDVQMLSRRLHPIGLGTLGMDEALRQECDALRRRTRLSTILEGAVASDEVPQDVAVAAVRIAQEAMHNVEKHAAAKEVRVETEVTDSRFVLAVTDDGAGFDLGSNGERGLGLVTMRERAAAAGGVLDVQSARGAGTRIVFTVSLEEHAE